MIRILTLIPLLFLSQVHAAPLDPFVGKWTGECLISPAFNGTTQFLMTLDVSLSGDGAKWLMIYEASGSLPHQVRDYELNAVDAKIGHYEVDEKNGFLLDSFLTGNKLRSSFFINGKLVQTEFAPDGNQMRVEMPMSEPLRQTCLTGDPKSCVLALGLKSTQSCRLKRNL